MSPAQRRQKEIERLTLESARCACSLFPSGEIELFEEPDLKIRKDAGWLGIELTELLRPPEENGFRPVQTEDFHREVIHSAETRYRATGAPPVDVLVYFFDEKRSKLEDPEGWSRLEDRKTGSKLEKMAQSLADFVTDRPLASGRAGKLFSRRADLPTGFEVIRIAPPPRSNWWSGESANLSALDQAQLAAVIDEKNELLPKYRAKANCPIWLLVTITIARGVPIPSGVDNWKFASNFDKVLLFSEIDNRVFDIGRIA
jgi:hypothetical protein